MRYSFYIMVLMAVAAAISGAASAPEQLLHLRLLRRRSGGGPHRTGSHHLRRRHRPGRLHLHGPGHPGHRHQHLRYRHFQERQQHLSPFWPLTLRPPALPTSPRPFLNAFTYAGFQCVTLPTMVACGTAHEKQKRLRQGLWILLRDERRGFGSLGVHAPQLAGVYTSVEGGTTIPTLTVCKGHRYARHGSRVRHLPAPLPHLHRRDHHLRLCGPV